MRKIYNVFRKSLAENSLWILDFCEKAGEVLVEGWMIVICTPRVKGPVPNQTCFIRIKKEFFLKDAESFLCIHNEQLFSVGVHVDL